MAGFLLLLHTTSIVRQRMADCESHRLVSGYGRLHLAVWRHRPLFDALGRSGPPADSLRVADVALGVAAVNQRPVVAMVWRRAGCCWTGGASAVGCNEGSLQGVVECATVTHRHHVVQNRVQRCADEVQNTYNIAQRHRGIVSLDQFIRQ